jgi:hypothetical protein
MRASAVAAVLLLLAGCRHGAEPKPPPAQPPWRDPAKAPPNAAELRYLVDPETGAVVMEVPPEVLASVRVQLFTTGHEAEARQLDALYDRQTGRVRDPARAKAAEAVIRGAGAPPIPPTDAQPGPAPAPPPALPGAAGGALPGSSGGAR